MILTIQQDGSGDLGITPSKEDAAAATLTY
jgi:hypothetical protein